MTRLKYIPSVELKGNTEVKNTFSKRKVWGFLREKIIRSLEKNNLREQKILDISCGAGEILEELNRKGFKNLYSVDVDDYRKNFFSKHKKINLSYEKLPFKENYFDVIICTEAFEHYENPFHVAREISRVLKPLGTLYLTVPSILNIWERLYFLLFAEFFRYPFKGNHLVPFTNKGIEKCFLNTKIKMVSTINGVSVMPFFKIYLPKIKMFSGAYLKVFTKII